MTLWYRWALAEVQTLHRAMIGDGSTLRPNSDDTAQATARAVGYASGIETALELKPESVS